MKELFLLMPNRIEKYLYFFFPGQQNLEFSLIELFIILNLVTRLRSTCIYLCPTSSKPLLFSHVQQENEESLGT